MPDRYGTPEMFDVAPADAGHTENRATTGPRATAHGSCPTCTATRVGLAEQGGHLVWKAHDVKTWGKADWQCRSAGVRLCEAPAKRVREVPYWEDSTPPACPCGRRSP